MPFIIIRIQAKYSIIMYRCVEPKLDVYPIHSSSSVVSGMEMVRLFLILFVSLYCLNLPYHRVSGKCLHTLS